MTGKLELQRARAIKLGRVALDLTQKELGDLTGITHVRISQIECGYKRPRPDELDRLRAVLSLPDCKEVKE